MSGKDEIARLRSIMAAAADEIEEHWEAHCDNDGFGPVNLVRRLRTGKGDYRCRTQSISKCGHEANIKESCAGGCAMNDDRVIDGIVRLLIGVAVCASWFAACAFMLDYA